MKNANNPFNLHIGDWVTIKGDDNHLSYGVTGFTASGYPVCETTGLVLRGVAAEIIASVIRKDK